MGLADKSGVVCAFQLGWLVAGKVGGGESLPARKVATANCSRQTPIDINIFNYLILCLLSEAVEYFFS